MKFTVTMKDPDGVFECVRNAVEEEVKKVDGLSEDERERLVQSRAEEVGSSMKRWFQYAEYLTVEVDTDAGTCVVVPNK